MIQWHGQVRYMTELPLVYLYSALVIQHKPFSRIAAADQLIVRERLETAQRGLDLNGADDDTRFKSALIDTGIQPLTVDPDQIVSWRKRVLTSNRRLGERGEFNIVRLEELESHLTNYRRQDQVALNPGTGSHP